MRLPSRSRAQRFLRDVYEHTPFLNLLALLALLWVTFAAALFVAESGHAGSPIDSLATALYWGVAAFSTAGIAPVPQSGPGQLLGGLWIVIGSTLFFGGIVATITLYFMRPMQRPHRKIIDAIEYNLEQMNDLSLEELELLQETVDTLIDHVERLKKKNK